MINIQVTIHISGLDKLSYYSNHQVETEYYFCFILIKAN